MTLGTLGIRHTRNSSCMSDRDRHFEVPDRHHSMTCAFFISLFLSYWICFWDGGHHEESTDLPLVFKEGLKVVLT